jgi:putative acetyltransferase
MIRIRPETPEDFQAITEVNVLAFAQSNEAELVEKLRRNCPEIVSLVAEDNHRIVGHILFTPVTIEGIDQSIQGMGLAPMAVLPERQREGIGSLMVRQGLTLLKARGVPYVIVLGHPEFYPRFGFQVASQRTIACQWQGVPDDAFRICVFDQDSMQRVTGVARYRPEFSEAM